MKLAKNGIEGKVGEIGLGVVMLEWEIGVGLVNERGCGRDKVVVFYEGLFV